jgi:hypothetical protein
MAMRARADRSIAIPLPIFLAVEECSPRSSTKSGRTLRGIISDSPFSKEGPSKAKAYKADSTEYGIGKGASPFMDPLRKRPQRTLR